MNKNILLVEPGYKNKYPPLGLMKIAQYHGGRGKRDKVRFVKGCDQTVLGTKWDRVYVTSLFSFEFDKIAESILYAIQAAKGDRRSVFVGGIAASLMTERFRSDERWRGVRIIKGLLSDAPALSLDLDDFQGEFYADDVNGTPIEDLVPDYSILDHISYQYPVRDAYFVYATRGCIRSCHFCGVPKLEGGLKETESVSAVVREIERLYGPKKDLIFMDNNVVASSKFKSIIEEIIHLGFTPGEKLHRNGRTYVRRVDFNQGVDARILAKDPMFLRELSRIALRPLRIAFDHWGLRGPYEQSIRYAHDFNLNDLSNYMLYNFHDSPRDLFERMRLNVSLNEELNIRIFSFPMRYQPTDLPSRSHVGEKWTRYQLRSLQIILQATHGVVSGEPEFFKAAFGDTAADFDRLLMRPHHTIFNRDYYDNGPGSAQFEEYSKTFSALSTPQKTELLEYVSVHDPSRYAANLKTIKDSQLRKVLEYYPPPPKAFEQEIWAGKRPQPKVMLTDEEIVEDAGLDEEIKTEKPTRLKRSA